MKFILILILSLITNVVFSQNLVFNSDFESTVDTASCTMIPANISEFSVYMGRMRFPGGLIPPPSIKFGKYWYNNNDKLARSGKYCGGNVFYKPGSCKGLVSMTLVEKLVKDEKYVVEFYIRNLAGNYFLNNIDIAFSNNNQIFNDQVSNSRPPNTSLKNIRRLISYMVDSTIDNNWHKIHVEYIANGGEKSLMVGCFGYPKKFIKTPIENQLDSLMGDFSVYIIDDALVMKKTDFEIYEFENNIILKSILFDSDSYNINSDSKSTLDSLIKLLKTNSSINISLTGYTDPNGEENHNQILGKKRAESVNNFLINHGIEPNRININYSDKNIPHTIKLPLKKYYLSRRVEYLLY